MALREAVVAKKSSNPSRLVIETGENEGMIFPLRESVVSIGRGPDNAIQIIDSHMSRNHTLLILNEGRWFARDLDSKNGTQVNGELTRGDQPLAHGDKLLIGETSFIYEQEPLKARVGADTHSGATTGLRVLKDENEAFVASQLVKLRGELGREDELSSTGFSVPTRDTERLNALYQVADMISATLDQDELLERVLDVIERFLAPDRAGVLLYDKQYDILLPKIIRRPADTHDDIIISHSIITQAVAEQSAVLVSDAPRDQRFKASDSVVGQRIHCAICAPLICKDEVLGVLYLDRRRPENKYGENDLKLVAGIANQAALAIANSQMHRLLLEQHAQERELEIARSIQQNLLPKSIPNPPGFEISGLSHPARMVGGDYYDVIPLSDGRYVLAIADVSGKGVPAALLIAALRAAVQIEVRAVGSADELVAVVDRLNQMIFRDTNGNMFVTMVLALLDPIESTLTYCNAGHVHPLLCHADGAVESLDTGGCFLGIMPGLAYEHGVVELTPGALLTMYSDGVTDTMNEEQELFGLQRLIDTLITSVEESAEGICCRLDELAGAFRKNAEPFDDFTLLVLKVRPLE
jgi:serine phosphatase RsbU (regulator of sigma subunit)